MPGLKEKIQKKIGLLLLGMNEEEAAREATPEEIREMWEAFYSLSPEDRRIWLNFFKAFFSEVIPPDLLEEMEKRIDEKGFI